MAYAAGTRNERVTFLKRKDSTVSDFGRKAGEYEETIEVWAKVDFTRGMKAMREGALDAYDTIMVRCAWFQAVTRDCRLKWNGTTYQIESFHADKQKDQIQITASELQK